MKADHVAEVRARPEVLALLGRDPVMARLIERHGPYRWGVHGVFPALLRAVVGQQVSNAAARAIFGRLAEAVGLAPERLLAAGEEALRSVGVSRAKARAILNLARLEVEGAFAGFTELPDAEVRRRLLAQKGVGPWTVDMVLIFGLGRLDVWPVRDLGLRQKVKALYGLEDEAEVQALGERFAPYRSVAAHYLWAENDLGRGG